MLSAPFWQMVASFLTDALEWFAATITCSLLFGNVDHIFKQLKLPTMETECEQTALRCAKENVDHLGYLLQLAEGSESISGPK